MVGDISPQAAVSSLEMSSISWSEVDVGLELVDGCLIILRLLRKSTTLSSPSFLVWLLAHVFFPGLKLYKRFAVRLLGFRDPSCLLMGEKAASGREQDLKGGREGTCTLWSVSDKLFSASEIDASCSPLVPNMSAYFMAKITQSMCESEPSCKANLRRAKGLEVSIGWFFNTMLENADGWIRLTYSARTALLR